MRDKPDHQPPKQSVKAGRNENYGVAISSPVQYPSIRGLLNGNKRQISGHRPQIFRLSAIIPPHTEREGNSLAVSFSSKPRRKNNPDIE